MTEKLQLMLLGDGSATEAQHRLYSWAVLVQWQITYLEVLRTRCHEPVTRWGKNYANLKLPWVDG